MKYTKKQNEAIDTLLCYLDELDNKPKRLFGALYEIAVAFNKEGAIPSLKTAEEEFYGYISHGERFDLLFETLKDFKQDTWKWQLGKDEKNYNRAYDMIDAVERFVWSHIRKMSDDKFSRFM